jgi:hypothetical protein
MGTTPAAPRFVATLAVLAAIYVGATLYGGHDIITWLKGAAAEPSAPAAASAPVTASAVPTRLTVSVEPLGRSPVARFAFDAAVAGRVVACDAVSIDGGRTWPPLEQNPVRRAMLLGGPRAAAPAAGPDGRILCGDVILPRADGPTGLDEIQIAAEWTGSSWQPAGLSVAAASGDPQLNAMVGYDAEGQPIAVRGDRLHTATGEAALPGRAEAFAMDAGGALYAAISPAGRRSTLMWTPEPGTPWAEVPAPGPVRALATDGRRAWAIADMLGRGTGATWAWTRWPTEIVPLGVAARGDVVVVWGGPKYANSYSRGVLLISRDGGATLAYASLERVRPTWVALDPHHANELLVMGDDQTLSRIRF